MYGIERITELLRKRGYKLTPQRLAIIKLLFEKEGVHHTAESIFRALIPNYPSLSYATIYNTLQVLADVGAVKVICVDAGRAYFDTVVKPHSHLICRNCKKIIDIMDFEIDESERKKVEEAGHKVVDYSLNFFVICKECRKGEITLYEEGGI